ncbi:hypothetical protein L207DRAFT_301603 [Hyaloscypha variabilis F]|uniref:Heterokaryon incompatibility domain-containing protein n=1 Tax=Hyaloscypha variabilis (strain UAMH 11265 / GT02V1 / F) TaxID=1149755 RepID=A0A2J6RYQ4_HYAVF|nr:hypothetical protein L207DRAFT_301603 [Hyaloscypha variabilis F]
MATYRSLFAVPFRVRLFASTLQPLHTLPAFKASSREAMVMLRRSGFYRLLSSFSYKPLDATRNEIRLINIHRRKPQTRADQPPAISCSMKHVSLDSSPSFMALSYVWGDPDITTPILIDGEVFNVTVNLWQALNHLENELMKDIYSQADLVLVWLGPSGEYGEFVLEKIERVGLQMIRIASAIESEEEDDAKVIKRINKEAKKLLTGSTNDDSDIPFHLMGHIFNRTFWERIWIVQEIYFAQCIVLMCGAKLCAWQAFVVACTVFQDKQLKAL